MPDVVKKQTIKQAKASYKSRGRPSLSEKEQRQLERALELEQRAERAKEAEKRRAEAAKKKTEAEKRYQSEKQRQQLGSQRRYDRFGYKSSQFHLGAFFGQKPAQIAMKPAEVVQEEEAEDGFDDDGLDDDSLLEALQSPINQRMMGNMPAERGKERATLMPPPPRPVPTTPHNPLQAALPQPDEDLSGFFDELGSSTQIARELDSSDDEFGEPPDFCHASFSSGVSSGSLGLTEEDMEMLDPPQAVISEKRPEGALPSRTATSTGSAQQHVPALRQKLEAQQNRVQSARGTIQPAINAPKMAPPPRLTAFGSGNSSSSTRTAYRSVPPPPRPLPPASDTKGHTPRQMLPPPLPAPKGGQPLLVKAATTSALQQQPLPQHVAKSPFKRVCDGTQNKVHDTAAGKRNPPPIRGPFLPASSLYCSPDLGFTMTQLESLVDDDLQLTQFA